jgi:GNAT superfamily N-acetyltransferase
MKLVAYLWRGLNRALSPFGDLCCGILFERSLLDPLPVATTSLDVVVRLATAGDIAEISRLYSGDSWLFLGESSTAEGAEKAGHDAYLDRLRRGELCFLAIGEGRIAHVNWICRTWGDALPGHPIRLQAGEVYTTDALTTAGFRGKGLHAVVLRAMLEHAQARGDRHAFTLARLDRTDSHKGLLQLGWRECGRTIYFLPRRSERPRFLWRRGNLAPLFRQYEAAGASSR